MSRGYYVPCAPFLYFVPDSGGHPQPQQQQQAQAGGGSAGAAMDVQLQRHPPPPSSVPATSAAAAAAAAAPFQYFLHEQARSLVALQELQHEVGALLEFRELVMDTFPHLRSKMHSTTSTTPVCTSPPVAPAPAAGWSPGVRVRRKLVKEQRCATTASELADDSSAESSNKLTTKASQPKSSEGASSTSGSTVQDSGFSTETKEHLSSVLSPKLPPSSSTGGTNATDSMDELWNLLDVIQRKGSRLRDEVEELHTKLQRDTEEKQQQQQQRLLRAGGGESRADVAPEEWIPGAQVRQDVPPDDEWTADVRSWGEDDGPSPPEHILEVQRLRHERDVLLDKITEMEAETLQSRARVSQLQAELRQVAAIRRELESQLSVAVRARLHSSSEPPTPVKVMPPCNISSQVGRASCFQPVARSASSPSPRRLHPSEEHMRPPTRLQNRESRIPRLLEPRPLQVLGRLDGVLSEPALVKRSLNGLTVRPDSRKVAAILREHSPLELRRHLITTVVENQALQLQLQTASSTKGELAGELERVREENDDLRFQLEEKSIELEGTRARVRVLEKHQLKTSIALNVKSINCSPDETLLNSSSTESAHDVGSPVRVSVNMTSEKPPEPPKRHHHHSRSSTTTIKGKKPSRIPLPPPKAFSAPSKTLSSSTKTITSPSPSSNSLQGRAALRKQNNDSPSSNSSLQNNNNLKSSRESISSVRGNNNKESLKLSACHKVTPARKNATSSRPASSPSGRQANNVNVINKTAGMLELDNAKDTKASSTTTTPLPLVHVALEPINSFPVDSLNEFFPILASVDHRSDGGGIELMPWQSSPSEYFDSMNSASACEMLPPFPPPEQLWQRHCDVTDVPNASSFRPTPQQQQPDSLDVACWEAASKWTTSSSSPTNANNSKQSNINNTRDSHQTANKNTPVGLWRVSEHIETILRQISRQTKCDYDN